MAKTRDEPSDLPRHVETTVETIANLHADHETSANRSERVVDAITNRLGRPFTSLVLLAFCGLWIGVNVLLRALGLRMFDEPPFGWLELALTLSAALMTTIILASQHRTKVLTRRHAQLALQLAFLSDHKQAKIIALLEELRRDDPLIQNRRDRQAEAMTKTADPNDVLDAIEETRDELISESGGKKE